MLRVSPFRYPDAVYGLRIVSSVSGRPLKHFFSEIVVYPLLRPENDGDLVVLLYHISWFLSVIIWPRERLDLCETGDVP